MSVVEQNSHAPAEISVDESAIPASLLDLLSAPDDHSLDLESPLARTYLDRLVSLGLDDLVQEPSVISNERSGVDLELVNLCYREYPTFTSVHQCSAAIGAAFDDFDNSLDKLIESIPALEGECRQFGKGTSELQNARKRAVLLKEHEDKLLDVLEIPQLMETCVRNGYYQEALELSSHISSLREKHHAIIVDDVADEANGILQLMTAQLLGVLREPVKLPALIKAVGYLRKLQDLDDSQLGLAFLSSRLHNYRARLIEIEKDRAEPVRYLRRYIDLFREHVFDIISQYTTIFSGITGDQLAQFVNLCVDDLVQLVHKYIPRIASDSAAMSSILVQLGYCSLSFARAGLDFSSLLVDPFTSSIELSFDQASESAASYIKTTLSLDPQPPALSSLVSAAHLQQVLADSHSPPIIRHPSDSHTPPAVLAHYPPIARFLNEHLTALNSLRLLAPFQALPTLQASQNKSVGQATAAVLDYVEQAVATEMSGELTRSSGSRHRHTRTNSTPRSHLIRRNTETQLSAETLAAKRRETKRACVAFADAWILACQFLRQAMALVLETHAASRDADDEVLKQLEEWIEANKERDLDAQKPETPLTNGVNPMNSLEEGPEVVEGLDESEATKEATSHIDSKPTSSPEAVSALPSPSTSRAPPSDALPTPTTDRIATVDLPIESSVVPSVEEVASTANTHTTHDPSEGLDLPPFPSQAQTPSIDLGSFAEPSSMPEPLSTPPEVTTQSEVAEGLSTAEDGSVQVPDKSSSRNDLAVVAPEQKLEREEAPEQEVASESQDDTHPDSAAPVGTPIDSEVQSLILPPVESNASDEISPAAATAEPEIAIANASTVATESAPEIAPVEPEPQLDDSPVNSTPAVVAPSVDPAGEIQETAAPEDEDEGTEPGTGTVTPTAEPNGQETSAPKTNKKKKKKKGKK